MKFECKDEPMLSVILPAYNEANNIERVVEELVTTLKGLQHDWEILIVDDGSQDTTHIKAKNLEGLNGGKVRALTYSTNRGKGFALKYGFERSKGDIVIFMDADLDLPPHQIRKFLEIMNETGADAVTGSKRHPESRVRYPLTRRFLSFVYYTFTRFLFNLKVKDTQVGLKVFKREVLENIMPRILVKRYAFDVELLANAGRKGYKIVEAPVILGFKFDSRVDLKAIWRMFVDTLAIAYRMYIKKYYDRF